MGRKTKKHRKHRHADLFEQAQRHLQNRNFKQALKDARVCFRQESSSEHKQLLERASIARAEELERSGLAEQSRSVVETLLQLRPGDPEVKGRLPELLLRLGLAGRPDAVAVEELPPERRARIETSIADAAVLHPERTSASVPQVRAGAAAVRCALDALYAGDEARALEGLRDVPRKSPFADWKLLVRGLAAYYRGDRDEMLANWDRLDPERPASRIARPLTSLALCESTAVGDDRLYGPLRPVEHEVLGSPVLSDLRSLARSLAARDCDETLSVLRRAWKSLRRSLPQSCDRIVQAVASELISDGEEDGLNELISFAPPPALDPRWNRARALLMNHPDLDELYQAEDFWLDYLDDLAELPALSEDERTLARALVWRHIGEMFVDEASEPDWFGRERLSPQELDEVRDQAVEAFENALNLAPQLASAYRELAAAQRSWGRKDGAARTLRRWLDREPDALEALVALGRELLDEDRPLEARSYLDRAHQLQPLDRAIADVASAAHLGAARHLALEGQWDAGRAEFAAAERVDPSVSGQLSALVRKAVFELKAGETARGEELVEQARGRLDEPTPALLALSIESSRYRLPQSQIRLFEDEWCGLLKERCTSQTAGAMAELMAAYLAAEVEFPHRERKISDLTAYLRRTSRIRFRADDLRKVCNYFDLVGEDKLFEKYVHKGWKKFPDHAYFQFREGELEFEKGPFACRRQRAYDCFQRACEAARNSSGPADLELAEQAKTRMSYLMQAGLDQPPRGRSARGPMPHDLLDLMEQICDEFGVEPEELLGALPHGENDGPARRGPRKK